MVLNALHAARVRGGRDGEHARAAEVNAGGGTWGPCWSALSAPQDYTTAEKRKRESHSPLSLSIVHDAQSDEIRAM